MEGMQRADLQDWIELAIAQAMREFDKVKYHELDAALDEVTGHLRTALTGIEELEKRP
jgi:hypothetical protein